MVMPCLHFVYEEMGEKKGGVIGSQEFRVTGNPSRGELLAGFIFVGAEEVVECVIRESFCERLLQLLERQRCAHTDPSSTVQAE